MKKLSLLIVAILLFSACKPQTAQTPVPQTEAEVKQELFDLSKAIAEGKSVSCLFTDTKTNTSMDYLMKEKKMKIMGMKVPEKETKGSVISDGMFLYTWDDITKQGFKMALPDEKDLKTFAQENGQTVPTLESEEDRKKFEDQGYRINCREATIADSEFVPPTDVVFSDLNKMMESTKNLPTPGTQNLTPEQKKQIDDMMKQYGQQ